MAISLSQAFKRTSANPIDESMTLTKAQMKTVNDNLMPDKYFTIGQDDGKIYLYDKSNDVDETTGRYRKFEGGGGGGASSMEDLEDVLLTSLANGQTLIWDSANSKWVNGNMPSIANCYQTTDPDNGTSFEDEDKIPLYNASISSKRHFTWSNLKLALKTYFDSIYSVITTLGGLNDTSISNPTNGQFLKYNSTSGKWENASGGGGGTSDYYDLDNKPSINNVTLAGNKSSDDLGLITKAVNDLTNYYNKTSSYSKAEVDAMIAAAKNGRFVAVATLPTTDIQTNVIYLVPSSDPKTGNVKDEYINLDGTTAGWEKIGDTDIDLALSALSDVNITSPTDNQVLKYNSTSGKWENGTGGGGASAVSDLTDVDLDNVQNGQVLKWNSTDEVWENANESGGGGGGHTIEDSEGTDLTQRDTLQFGEGFLAEDDDTNEKTVISPDVMQSGDMADVISVLPTIHAGREVFVSGLLVAGETSITLTSPYITTSSIIDPYTSVYGVNPIDIVVTTGQVVLTFTVQSSDIGVGICIK